MRLTAGEPDAVASIIFIAGTTIEPRAAMLSHSNLLANVGSVSRLLHPYPADEFLSTLPLNAGFEFTNGATGTDHGGRVGDLCRHIQPAQDTGGRERGGRDGHARHTAPVSDVRGHGAPPRRRVERIA